jgi:hypothetical protein
MIRPNTPLTPDRVRAISTWIAGAIVCSMLAIATAAPSF